MSKLSRRAFLATAGSAAASPAAALAAPDRFPADPGRLSDREQLDACMANMQAILARMHPNVRRQSIGYEPRQDGTYYFWVHCEREFLPWTGPGLYRVSVQGYLMEFWIEKFQRRGINGVVCWEGFNAWLWIDDDEGYLNEARTMSTPCIVAKLDGRPPAWCIPQEEGA